MGQLEISFEGGRPGEAPVFTVGQIVRGANRVLEQRFANVWVEGEITGLKVAASGHLFFSMVEEGACLPVAMWRLAAKRLRFRVENGQTLRVGGRLGIYDKQGRFQLYADRAEPVGLGALMLQLEQLKARLQQEGLFDRDRKRALPVWPRTVGVVTSAHGAAIHDILRVARHRCPSRILLAPAAVQGDGAAHSLLRALERLAAVERVDVVILGRGGGSIEDLWAFNDEALVRAVAAFPVPVVAAVGHEVDFTLVDFAADVRAATPSQAAELVFPDHAGWSQGMAGLELRLHRAVERRIIDERVRLDHLIARLRQHALRVVHAPRNQLGALDLRLRQQHPRARLRRDRRALEGLAHRLERCGHTLTGPLRTRLARANGALAGLSPLAVLERGYAVVTAADGAALRVATDASPGDTLGVRLHRGNLAVRVVRDESGGDPT